MNTGIYYRVQRNGRWKSIELDDMSVSEIETILKERPSHEVAMLVFHLTKSINYFTCGDYCRKERYEQEHPEE